METSERLRLAALICALLLALPAPAPAKIIYVDDDANAPGDGSSWTAAYRYLQDALADADNSQEPVEIRVAQGTYRPDQSSACPEGTRDRNASFRLLDGVAILGGFAGVGAPDPNDRDITLYGSVLTGDLAGDDIPVVDPRDLLTEPTRAENTCHIVTAEPCGRSAVLEGFTIRSGVGGALYLLHSIQPCRPSIRNCTFTDNRASAACLEAGVEPELTDCLFLRNVSWGGGAAIDALVGGRNLPPEADKFVISGCAFVWNCAVGYSRDIRGTGGAITVRWGSPSIIEHCTFVGNSAEIGGAIYSRHRGNIVNCRFVQNMADQAGGAVYFEGTELNMTSCTLSGNAAPSAKACYGGDQAKLSITNTILWDGGDEIGVSEQVQMNVAYSDVQGGWAGAGNIDVDPLFASPGYWDPNGTPDDPNDDFWVEGDYHLKSQTGRWDPRNQSWIKDDVTSPCIDGGDPNNPVGDEPGPNGGRVNMGAYGGTAEASESYLEKPQ